MIIVGTEEQPNIILDKVNNRIEFSGKSLLEDARTFYKPILNWIDDYSKNPSNKTEIIYRMIYFNTSSSKIFLDMMQKFGEMYHNGHDLEVYWYYYEDDEDMMEAGEIYAERVNIPFQFIDY